VHWHWQAGREKGEKEKPLGLGAEGMMRG
jgi:hypothetical protein